MPDDTTILSLPLILPAQAQKHVTHNEALAQLDLIVQLAVISRTLTTTPALPTLGDRYIVAAGATGAWVGQGGKIALYAETGWQFTQPLPGWQAHVLAEGQTAVFDGLAWAAVSDGPLTVTQLGVSATADATNRLSVAGPATLFNHAGAGHQLKLNKALATDTASLLFQTGFGGRAEMGTAGSDNFAIKVSADGTSYATALSTAAASGEVTLPAPLHLGGQAADPAAPPDGTLWLNTTSGQVKVKTAGVTVALGGGGGVSDGDKGDITVSSAGATWTIDPGAVSLAKLASIATDSFLGRDTAGTGTPEVLSPAAARGILNVSNGATANASDAALRDRATHTGTQVAATISDFATAVAATSAVVANTAKVTNATHSGDVSGSGVLTIQPAAITGKTAVAPDAADYVLISDTSDSGLLKKALIAGFATSPGGAANELQANNGAGGFAGMSGALRDGGDLALPFASSPASPTAGRAKLIGSDKKPGAPAIGVLNSDGLLRHLQEDLGEFNIAVYAPAGNGTTVGFGNLAVTAIGGANTSNVATGTHHEMRRRIQFGGAAAANSIAGVRGASNMNRVGRDSNAPGGFFARLLAGNAGGTNTTRRSFMGMIPTAAFTDVEPSSLTNFIALAQDASDANFSIMHNDGSGTATKIDLGSGFARDAGTRQSIDELQLFCPNTLGQSVSYRAIRYATTGKTIAAEATGTITTNLPTVSTLIAPAIFSSAGGTSTTIGVSVFGILVGTEY